MPIGSDGIFRFPSGVCSLKCKDLCNLLRVFSLQIATPFFVPNVVDDRR